MLIFNQLPVVFPWLQKRTQQARYRDNVDAVCDYKLITPSNAILPFQFRRVSDSGNGIASVKIHEINSGAVVRDITAQMLSLIYTTNAAGYDYFLYNGGALTGMTSLPFGFYDAEITFADATSVVSEMFHVPANAFLVDSSGDPVTPSAVEYIRFKFWNGCDLSPIFYGGSIFKQSIYLDTEITSSEPEIKVEAEKDGDGEDIPLFQRVTIAYRISSLVSDSVKIALTVLPLHDNIQLTTAKGVETGDVERMSISSTVEANGALSTVEILFEQDLAMVKKGCCDVMEPGECNELTDPTLDSAEITGSNIEVAGDAGGADNLILEVSTTDAGPWTAVTSINGDDFSGSGVTIPTPAGVTDGKFLRVRQADFGCPGTSSDGIAVGTTSGEVTDGRLLEDGDFRLLEDGDFRLLE